MTNDLTDFTNSTRVSKQLSLSVDPASRRLCIETLSEGECKTTVWLDLEATLWFRDRVNQLVSSLENPSSA